MASYQWLIETPEERGLQKAIQRLYILKDKERNKTWEYRSKSDTCTLSHLQSEIKKCERKIIILEKEISTKNLQRQLK